ncbi:MAG: hypothetical protein U1F83_11615 [Verrucomicrobiota bacterium]
MITQLQLSQRQMWVARGAIAVLLAMAALTMVFGPGAVKVVKDGDTTIYSGSLLPSVTSAVLGMMTCLVGLFYWRQTALFFRTVAVVLFVISALCLFNAPTGLAHRVVVTPEYFSHRIGSWYSPVEARIEFSSVLYMAVELKKSDHDSGRLYELVCLKKPDNKPDRVPLHDLMKKALPEIFERARKLNIFIGDSPDGHPIPSDF